MSGGVSRNASLKLAIYYVYVIKMHGSPGIKVCRYSQW
ncbi:hypothetical protein C7440_2366 [Pusillimonas noertemannii]|uniref:Uncharacterized protein n=1 Tax=Pusillimonas noertemannii TaxID=305977 RepID=A0A2U1CKV9_9BURK|nr:hypothetical protein C7440_2366 [Pusillimonas noertemannii]